jgi:hypothetical protein
MRTLPCQMWTGALYVRWNNVEALIPGGRRSIQISALTPALSAGAVNTARAHRTSGAVVASFEAQRDGSMRRFHMDAVTCPNRVTED